VSVLRHLARRLAWSVFVVFVVTTATFSLNRALPSDPARMVSGPQARPSDVAKIRVQLGLDRPLAVQYAIFLKRIVRLVPRGIDPTKDPDFSSCWVKGRLCVDLGKSYQLRRPVAAVIADHLPHTIVLALAATTLSVLLGVGAGVVAALRRNTWVDGTAVGLALLGISAPTFLLGVLLQYVLAYQLDLLPLSGGGDGTLRDGARHLALPALTLGIFGAAYYTRLARDEVLGLLQLDHVRTARAKGLSRARVVLVHVLRNALVPIVTVIGLDLGALLGGAVITEQIFSWPGIGTLTVRAMHDRDGPVIVGTVLVAAISVVVASLVVDVLYAFLDPRTRAR